MSILNVPHPTRFNSISSSPLNVRVEGLKVGCNFTSTFYTNFDISSSPGAATTNKVHLYLLLAYVFKNQVVLPTSILQNLCYLRQAILDFISYGYFAYSYLCFCYSNSFSLFLKLALHRGHFLCSYISVAQFIQGPQKICLHGFNKVGLQRRVRQIGQICQSSSFISYLLLGQLYAESIKRHNLLNYNQCFLILIINYAQFLL